MLLPAAACHLQAIPRRMFRSCSSKKNEAIFCPPNTKDDFFFYHAYVYLWKHL